MDTQSLTEKFYLAEIKIWKEKMKELTGENYSLKEKMKEIEKKLQKTHDELEKSMEKNHMLIMKYNELRKTHSELIESEAFWKNEAIRNRSDLTLIQTTLRERFHITLKWETDDNGTRVDFLSDGNPVSSIFLSKSEVKKMEEKLADLERVQKHHKVTLEKQDKIIRYFKHYFNNPSKMNCLKPYYDVMDKELKEKYHQEFTMKFCQLNQELPADLQVDIPEGDLGQIHDAYFFFSGLALYLRFQ